MSEHFFANADITAMSPRVGDITRVTKDVTLESGGLLPENQDVVITHVSKEAPSVVGVKWHDKDGTHVMALEVSKLDVVGFPFKVDAEHLTEGGAMHPEGLNTGGGMQVTEDRPSIIKEFEWSITELQKVVEELYGRLSPVTRSEPETMLNETALPPSSEARSRLHDLQDTTASLRSLISRLEV